MEENLLSQSILRNSTVPTRNKKDIKTCDAHFMKFRFFAFRLLHDRYTGQLYAADQSFACCPQKEG